MAYFATIVSYLKQTWGTVNSNLEGLVARIGISFTQSLAKTSNAKKPISKRERLLRKRLERDLITTVDEQLSEISSICAKSLQSKASGSSSVSNRSLLNQLKSCCSQHTARNFQSLLSGIKQRAMTESDQLDWDLSHEFGSQPIVSENLPKFRKAKNKTKKEVLRGLESYSDSKSVVQSEQDYSVRSNILDRSKK